MRNRRLLAVLAIMLSFALVAAACGDDDAPSGEAASSDAGDDGGGGDGDGGGGDDDSTSTDDSGAGDDSTSADDSTGGDDDAVELTQGGDNRLRPEEESGMVGVISAENSQSGREVDFGIFEGKNISAVRVLAVPEATIQTELCGPTVEANGGNFDVVDADFDTEQSHPGHGDLPWPW